MRSFGIVMMGIVAGAVVMGLLWGLFGVYQALFVAGAGVSVLEGFGAASVIGVVWGFLQGACLYGLFAWQQSRHAKRKDRDNDRENKERLLEGTLYGVLFGVLFLSGTWREMVMGAVFGGLAGFFLALFYAYAFGGGPRKT